MTHISYKTAKRLKEFLGESVPEPMLNDWYIIRRDSSHPFVSTPATEDETHLINGPAAYSLHDLLSKPFCEAMALARRTPQASEVYTRIVWGPQISKVLSEVYYHSGLPAVEKELMKMMDGK